MAFVLQIGDLHSIPSLMPASDTRHTHIQLALTEEKLVPPLPLPPESFVGVFAERPSLANADRDWGKLNQDFVQVVLTVIEKLRQRGYPMALLEGYRSPERQDALYENGGVTKAKGGHSQHQFGLAVDLAPVRDGKVVISERDTWAMEAYRALGEEAEALGLTWGGRWSFRDYGHIERTGRTRSFPDRN
ncbi:peptidoglycan L-alanyl-D-glutamate endopeptidase CwlK [Formivibrio citricus]|uniref:Peptidoglycan L-alanyl-D-glutamate endopeptidase CwlK n=2 Tax=Formivibrio citricus TaxID=83765 RepID=A0A1I4WTW9_9NEIS|nr:peptidoglycan L-alanyl-D-glutamate endopeptidase CwlK [Formivibrio citricus]